MKLLWDERAWSDYLSWQDTDKKTLRKVNAILKDIVIASCKGHYDN